MDKNMAENFPTEDLQYLASSFEEQTQSEIGSILEQLREKGLTADAISTYVKYNQKLEDIELTKKIDALVSLFSRISGVNSIFIRNETQSIWEVILVLDGDDLDIDDKILDAEEEYYQKYADAKLHIDLMNKLEFDYEVYIAKDFRKIHSK